MVTMDFMIKTLIALTISCGMSAFAADDQAALLGRLEVQRDYYTRSLGDIDQQHAKSVAALLAKYRAALDGLRAELQKAGDLPGLLASKAELERLDKDGTPPGAGNLSELAKLRKLQTISIDSSGTLEKETNRKIHDLVTDYVAGLEAEKKRLTIAGQIEAAKAYDAQIAKVTNGSREQAVARFVNGTAPAETPKPTEGNRAETGVSPNATGMTECRVFTAANPPPALDLEMKRQDLYGTRLGGKISGINATAELGTRADMETRRSTSSKTESGTLDNILRLTLSTQGPVQDVTVLVQYFGTDAGARGMVAPKEVDMETVKLKEISNNKVTIDFPAVSLRRYVYRYRSSSYSHKSESGQEFHGLMVSILDSKREIIYQTVTRQSMADLGELVWPAVKKASRQADIDELKAVYLRARDEYLSSTGSPDREKRRQAYEEARIRYHGLLNQQGGR